MAGLYYLGKPWQDNPEPDDYDDYDELPTHCGECGIELDEGEELLCTECTDELLSAPPRPPDIQPDEHLESDYEDRWASDDDPPF